MSAMHKRCILALGILLMASLVVAQGLERLPNFNNRPRSELIAASKRAGVQIDVNRPW